MCYFFDVPDIFQLKEPFGPPIMVVHYESCPFSRWQDTKMVEIWPHIAKMFHPFFKVLDDRLLDRANPKNISHLNESN